MVLISWIVSNCCLVSKRVHTPSMKVLLLLLMYLSSGEFVKSQKSQNNAQSGSSAPTVVNTKYGPVKGVRITFSPGQRQLDPVTAYLGIPYASPPVNAYRFMPPVAPLPWRETRMATSLPPACPQRFPDISNRTRALQSMTSQRYLFLQQLIPHLANQSEDCLYLNFYVPTSVPTDDAASSSGGRFPIILVIHGESWEWGSGNEFDGASLSSLGNHIVVTFNYRLGPLGFLKTSNQQSNFGLLDVIAALHWVKENSDSFGGDRNRITLLGYRTGAVVANLLLVAQIAKGLFQRTVLISGSVLSPWALQRRPEDVAKQLSAALGCVGKLPLSHPESDLAPCLRKKALADLLNFVPDSPKFLSPYAPYVDNILLSNPKSVMEGYGYGTGGFPSSAPVSSSSLSEQFLRAELLLIFTSSEGVQELNDAELKDGFESEKRDRILRTLVRNVFTFHQQEIFSIVRNEYTDWERPILHPIPLRDATVEAVSDCVAIGPILQVGLIHARRGAKTFVLHFSHVSKDGHEWPGYERLGSLEGDVVPYIMGLPMGGGGSGVSSSPFSFLANFTKQDAFVSDTLLTYLANFVRTGDPNGGASRPMGLTGGDVSSSSRENGILLLGSTQRQKSSSSSGVVHWDAFEPLSQAYMSLGTKPRMRNHYRGHKMALWLNLIPQIHLPGGADVTLSHHAFSDDNPNLYIGPVRPLSSYIVTHGADHNTIPGFGGVMLREGGGTVSPAGGHVTTECVESTESPLSQGTRHSVLRIDSNEVEVEIRGGGDKVGPLSSSPNAGYGSSSSSSSSGGDYDYTTALAITITVGVCLILLNLLVFSAIMCHRKRGVGGGGSSLGGSGSDSESRRSLSQGGTPQKVGGVYHEDYKWPGPGSGSCCSHRGPGGGGGGPSATSTSTSSAVLHPNDFPTTHLSSSQYHNHHRHVQHQHQGSLRHSSSGANPNDGSVNLADFDPPPPPPPSASFPHHHHPNCASSTFGGGGSGGGGTLPRSAPHHPYCETGGGGTLKRQHHVHYTLHEMAIPDCIQPAYGGGNNGSSGPEYDNVMMMGGLGSNSTTTGSGYDDDDGGFHHHHHHHHHHPPPGSSSAYMNQTPGGVPDSLLHHLPPPPEPTTRSVSTTPLRPSAAASINSSSLVPVPSSSSPSATNSTTNTTNSTSSTNQSPNNSTSTTTLVGVLKRHPSSSGGGGSGGGGSGGSGGDGGGSTVKKRVQIQEISV